MVGMLGEGLGEVIRQICKEQEVGILKGHIWKDHVHLFVWVGPHLSISKLVQYLKGKSS